jgi:hypothetical protein
MPHDRSRIVADGQRRILDGSGRDYAARLRARLTRRAAPLSQRASLVGRIVIRFRISRFIRHRVRRLAPFDALYSSPRLSLYSQQPIHSEPHVKPRQTSNHAMERTADRCTLNFLR